MPTISNDLNKITLEVVDVVYRSMNQTLARTEQRWKQEARRKLNSTSSLYQDNIYTNVEFTNENIQGVITLKGFAGQLDEGFPAFDMKPNFAHAHNVKKKNGGGWYTTIPFRHTTPNSKGTNGTPMSRDIYGLAKKLQPNQSLKVNGNRKISWAGYQHKANINDGMRKVLQANGRSKYLTYRTISDKSDPMSWQHPGFKGIHLAESMQQYANKTFEEILKSNISKI